MTFPRNRRSRKPSAALRRAVRERPRCQYPGCESRRTDAHHIRYWSNGGETSYRNMISLRKRHHTLVHGTGILIVPAKDGFTFYTPQGTLIPGQPAAGLATLDALLEGADQHARRFQPTRATRAHLLDRLGRKQEAIAAYESAISLTHDTTERQYLEHRRDRASRQGQR